MLWAVFAILCLAVLALLIVPVLKGGREVRARVDYDIVIYRSQLAEIDQEIDEGLLSPEQAEAARTEVHRRMLAAEDAELKSPLRFLGSSRISRVGAAIAIAVIIPVGAGTLYVMLGAPNLPGKPYMWRIHNDPEFAAALSTDKMSAALQANPSPEGFAQLGRNYFSVRQYEQAAAAYRRAVELGVNDAVTWSEFGEAVVMVNGGAVVPEAMMAFAKALAVEPKSERSRFYLGLAEAQIGNARQAVAIWRDLEKTSAPDAPWLPMLREHIKIFAKQGGFDPASVPPSAPDPNAMGTAMTAMSKAMQMGTQGAQASPHAPAPQSSAASSSMMAAPVQPVRDPMVVEMVQRLADRLAKNPTDAAGWQRLAHAYIIIGEVPKAREAADRAVRLKPEDVGSQLALAEVQKAQKPDEETPKAMMATMRKVLQLDGSNAQALYYAGLAEAKAGHADQARAMWTKALAGVQADDPLTDELHRRLGALPAPGK